LRLSQELCYILGQLMSEFPEKLELFGGIYCDNLSKESFMVYLKNARSSLISLKVADFP
jgi:hypothetical protein